jgi:hypothetical protein
LCWFHWTPYYFLSSIMSKGRPQNRLAVLYVWYNTCMGKKEMTVTEKSFFFRGTTGRTTPHRLLLLFLETTQQSKPSYMAKVKGAGEERVTHTRSHNTWEEVRAESIQRRSILLFEAPAPQGEVVTRPPEMVVRWCLSVPYCCLLWRCWQTNFRSHTYCCGVFITVDCFSKTSTPSTFWEFMPSWSPMRASTRWLGSHPFVGDPFPL